MPAGPLLVIVPDRLSELAGKGEITERYYNPGEVFDEVHLLLCNDDAVDPAPFQKTVGRARLHIHALCPPSIQKSLGWHPALMRAWLKQGESLARQLKPALMRCHGLQQNALMAAHLRHTLGVPLVLSLHNHPDADLRAVTPWSQVKQRFILERFKTFEQAGLEAADAVIAVYDALIGFAKSHGAKDVRLIYNVINPSHLQPKTVYTLASPPRILSVGRQFAEKNPEAIILAMREVEAHLDIVGDGAWHERLQHAARAAGLAGKVTFHKAIPNDQLCASLPDYDLFAVHNQYYGIPKAVIEPLLAGLPVVVNRRIPEPVAELSGQWVSVVENTPQDYARAFNTLLRDDARRAALGRAGRAYALSTFDPAIMESRAAALYRELANG